RSRSREGDWRGRQSRRPRRARSPAHSIVTAKPAKRQRSGASVHAIFCVAFLAAEGIFCLVSLMTLADKVKQAGVVGAGGGGFPTHVKMASKADTVIANGAECEPLLHKDAVVMERQAAELVRGMQLAMEAV